MNISTFGTNHPVLGFALAAAICLLGTAVVWAETRSITVSFRDLATRRCYAGTRSPALPAHRTHPGQAPTGLPRVDP